MMNASKGELMYIGDDRTKYSKIIVIKEGTRCRYCYEELVKAEWGYICTISNEVQCERSACKKRICSTLGDDHEDVYGEFKYKGDKL